MNLAIDTNTEIDAIFLDGLNAERVTLALQRILRRFSEMPRNANYFPISVSHSVGPTGVLSVVAVFAKGPTN